MFTGLIQRMGDVSERRDTATGVRLSVRASGWLTDPQAGESIAVNGCCLTLVQATDDTLCFDVIPQTLALTTTGDLRVGDRVNLERSLRADALLGGHLVQGHVEGVGTVVGVDRTNGQWRTRISAPPAVQAHMIDQGSVTVDGVSLTVAATGADWFEVALIPETLQRTTLVHRMAGSRVNIEADVLSRMVAAQVQRQLQALSLRAAPSA
jgi:riboflavin synthase